LIYLDTSVVVPLFLEDVHSPRVATWIGGVDEPVVVSTWTVAEFSSAAAGQERMGQITLADRQDAEAAFDGWLVAVDSTAVVGTDLATARQLIRSDRVRLRTPDALHVAIALRLGCRLATLDQNMARAGADLGLMLEPL